MFIYHILCILAQHLTLGDTKITPYWVYLCLFFQIVQPNGCLFLAMRAISNFLICNKWNGLQKQHSMYTILTTLQCSCLVPITGPCHLANCVLLEGFYSVPTFVIMTYFLRFNYIVIFLHLVLLLKRFSSSGNLTS